MKIFFHLGRRTARSLLLTALALFLGFSFDATADDTGWKTSSFPNVKRDPAIGCSVNTTDDYWTCLAVQCDEHGKIGLYYEYSDGGTNQSFSVVIDGEKFPVTPESMGEGATFPTRLTGDVASIVKRLKVGKQVRLADITPPLNPGFDVFPLRGSSRAIGAVEAACGPAGVIPVSEGALLRDASGKVSIGKLNSSNDCAFAKTTGVVEKVQRDGPNGSIDGMTFLDDKYGSGFINVDALEAGSGLQKRRVTLEYLLTAGRRLSIGVHGCGAAGRVEKLVSATERP